MPQGLRYGASVSSVPPWRPEAGAGQPYYRSGVAPMAHLQQPAPPRRRQPTPVRLLTLALFLAVAGLTFYLGLAVYQEADLGRKFFDGTASLGELVAAEDQIVRIRTWQLIGYFASAVVLAIWTFLTVRNAAKRYPMGGHQPLLAAVLWFVPILHWFAPWNQLKKAGAGNRGNSIASLAMWQTFFVLQAMAAVASSFGDSFVGSEGLAPGDIAAQDRLIDSVHRQGIYYLIVGVLFLLAAIAAASAMPAVDRVASGADTA